MEVGSWHPTTDPLAHSCLPSPPLPAHHPDTGSHMNPPATQLPCDPDLDQRGRN